MLRCMLHIWLGCIHPITVRTSPSSTFSPVTRLHSTPAYRSTHFHFDLPHPPLPPLSHTPRHALFGHRTSYQTMQNQNRGGGDANGNGSTTSTTSNAVTGGSTARSASAAAGGERRGVGTPASNPRPPSISARPGFSDALIPLGDLGNGNGNGNPSTPDGGAAFNLLGLPPSPAPRSGATGASAWGATVGGGKGAGAGGGLRGSGDVMAGQVGMSAYGSVGQGRSSALRS